MKKKYLLFTLSAAFLYVALSSNATGPAHNGNGNRTGSPGAAGTCASAGCHVGGAGSVTGEVILRKKSAGPSSPAVVNYEAGVDYLVTIAGTGTTKPNFGFQLVALDESNKSVGTFSALPNNVHPTTSGGINIVEHTLPLTATGGNYSVSFEWKAPATNTSRVTFYGIINAVNGTGGSDNDVVSAPFQTRVSPMSVKDIEKSISINVYPNPAHNSLRVKIDNASSGEHMICAYDLNGKKMYEQIVTPDNGAMEIAVNTREWASGVYYIQVAKDGLKHVTPILKN